MGIQNLLPFVKNACRKGTIDEFCGQSVAVDVSCLLHRGLFGCASQVAQGQETDFYVRYVAKYVRTLLAINCHVVLVFDGQNLPAKQNVTRTRRENRDRHKRKGEQLLSEGKEGEAYDCFKQSMTITKTVVYNTIKAFRDYNMVDILVSPYEADAQLAYLTKTGMVYAVITEDSDLIAFGCERIIFKMDPAGKCTLYERAKLPKCLGKVLAKNFDFSKFRRICILSGCDYLQSGLPGIGLNKAATFMSKTSGTDLYQILPRIPRYLNMSSLKIKKEFIDDFVRAENTFLYQIVFDPKKRCQLPLTEFPEKDKLSKSSDTEDDFICPPPVNGVVNTYTYAGEIKPPSCAVRLALGNVLENPPLCDEFLLPNTIPEWSVWNPNYMSNGERMRLKDLAEKEIKNQCGAFMLSSPTKKKRKMEANISTNIDDILIITSDSPFKANESASLKRQNSDFDDEFVLPKGSNLTKIRCGNIKNICKVTAKAKREARDVLSSAVNNKYSTFSASHELSHSSKRKNSTKQDWDCDQLMKIYTVDLNTSSGVSPSTSQYVPDHDGKSENSLETNKINSEAPYFAAAVNPNSVRREPSQLYSNYFLAKGGVKMSGLSRHSANPFKKGQNLPLDTHIMAPSPASEKLSPAIEGTTSQTMNSSSKSSYRFSGLSRFSFPRNVEDTNRCEEGCCGV